MSISNHRGIEEPEPPTEAEQFQAFKDRAKKSKVVALELLGYSPLFNPSTLGKRDKAKVLAKMEEVFAWTDEELTAEFNDIVLDKILNDKADYNSLTIEQSIMVDERTPLIEQPVIDCGGNIVEMTDSKDIQ
tara:strand:+ start:60 stop:455 length:396 start_codon:yes stop_codon:yes gene_type:complete